MEEPLQGFLMEYLDKRLLEYVVTSGKNPSRIHRTIPREIPEEIPEELSGNNVETS